MTNVKREHEEESDGTLERTREAGNARGPGDYLSKRLEVRCSFGGGADGASKLPERQDTHATYFLHVELFCVR